MVGGTVNSVGLESNTQLATVMLKMKKKMMAPSYLFWTMASE
jgi:hypothetical protein